MTTPSAVQAEITAAAEAIAAAHAGPMPETVLVLGSGLGRFGEKMSVETTIGYDAIPGFPVSTVAGHQGRLLIGSVNGVPLICMQGRMHLYEGYPAARLALPIRTYKALGVKRLILTNAAGSLERDMGQGSLMVIEDHINFSGQNPLIGPNEDTIGPRFFDLSQAWDPVLRDELLAAGKDVGVDLHRGVYLQATGPNFETPAEVRMFARWGAHAVGMSTVPECLVARHCGLDVAGLSLITNLAAGIADYSLSHDETMAEGEKAFEKISRVMIRFLERIGSPS